MATLRLPFFLLLLCAPSALCEPTYTVVAPSKLRPSSDYHLSVQLFNSTTGANVNVTISGPSASGFNQVSQSVSVNPSEARILNLEIGEWSKGNYKLIVQGRSVSGDFEFRNETSLLYDPKSYSVFVQTDKSVYKPSQVVQFRAIIVNPSLVPNVPGSLNIYIKDPKENLIKQWKRIFTHRGVISESFHLSEQPPLGEWSITVDSQGQQFTKSFSVAEYVLPTFSVDVTLPPYATYNRSDVVATVKATYTYGKPVKGEVTLTVQPRIRHSTILFRPLEQFQSKLRMGDEGSVDIPVNIVRDLNLKSDFFEREIEFFALVEEGLTGRKYNKSAVMKIFHKEVKVDLIKTSKTFKPGLKYTGFLRVAYQDDKPVDDHGPPITLRYGYSYNDEAWNNTIEAVPSKGLVRIDLYPPRVVSGDRVFVIGFRAEYRGQTYYLENIDSAQSPSDNFLQVVALNDFQESVTPTSAKVGDEMNFEVNCTEPIKQVVVEVMAKGDIVLARNVHTEQSRNTLYFSIPITHRMTPKARLLVYYAREENREIVADALHFSVDGVFKTPVAVSSSVSQTKPGGQVDIRVDTKPSAYVGLLGVDQSVLLLKAGNDISQQDVIQELQSYDTGKTEESDRAWFPWLSADSTTAGEIFDHSGVVFLTNGLVHRQPYTRLGKRIFYTPDGGGVIVSNQPRPETPRALSSIRLDDTILEEGLQPPSFRLKHKSTSRIVLRKQFPETWIFANMTTGLDGVAHYSVDSVTGLGVAPDTLKINVFRPFFVKLSLPYSIIRGESVAIQAIVFNYQNKPVSAQIVLDNSKDEFEFTNSANEIEFAGKSEEPVREKHKTVVIPPMDGVAVKFLITPKLLGYIDIRVSARAENAGDAVVQKLLVKAEGQTQYFNQAIFVKSDQSNSVLKRNVSIDIPNNAIPGSVKVSVSGISDILGPTVNHLDDLLRMPYGCGEQNMINLVPNIVVLNYLARVNRLTEPIQSKAVGHIETGYQRQLTYRRDDGSFSAFGSRDKSGSTWLTAFVVKSFLEAAPHITVDNSVVNKSIEWLLTRQKKDGSFAEYGEVHNKALQGGSALTFGPNQTNDTSASLTAYVLIALAHEAHTNPLLSTNNFVISRASDFILNRLAVSSDPYEIAISGYALHLVDSPNKDFAHRKLLGVAKRDPSGYTHWASQPDKEEEEEAETGRLRVHHSMLYPSGVEVEATAYSLLTLVLRSELDSAIPVLRWLISQQNSNGGFSSTQDTVIGLQALGAIAQRISTATVKMDVKVVSGKSGAESTTTTTPASQSLHFHTDNALVLQKIQLDNECEWVEIEASGFGTAIVQVSHQYNVAVSAEKPAFFLNPQKDKTSTENYLQLSVCTFYKEGNSTNMAVMEVELPSGYNADVDALPAATRAKEVKRVDTANNDGTVFVYFDKVTRDELCITVPAHRTHHVANNKPVPVTIYDYYDRAKYARIFYEPTLVTFCDICPKNEVDCSARCAQSQRQRQLSSRYEEEEGDEQNGSGQGGCVASLLLPLLLTLLLTSL